MTLSEGAIPPTNNQVTNPKLCSNNSELKDIENKENTDTVNSHTMDIITNNQDEKENKDSDSLDIQN